jgi:hypothetical protein
MSSHQQRQRHGVHKRLAEGIGGLLIGAALVLFARSVLKKRASPAATEGATATDIAPDPR